MKMGISKFFYRHLLTLSMMGLWSYVLVSIGTPKSWITPFYFLIGTVILDWLKVPSKGQALLFKAMKRHFFTILYVIISIYPSESHPSLIEALIGSLIFLPIPILFDRTKMKNPGNRTYRSPFEDSTDSIKFGTLSWMRNAGMPGSPAYDLTHYSPPKSI